MSFIGSTREGEVVVLTLQRGKVNALNRAVIDELRSALESLAADPSSRALVLTGRGKFFSFGLDVPELYQLSRDEFTQFVRSFTELYTTLYSFPKPVVAALNGHAIAGGCMLALACDRRLMARGNGKIGLNEITFGSSVFAGSVEMLRAWVGEQNAGKVLFSGAMFQPEEALGLGLVDWIIDPADLLRLALEEAGAMGRCDPQAFAAMKRLLRGPIVETMRRHEEESIKEFVSIWYSEATRRQLKGIEIRRS